VSTEEQARGGLSLEMQQSKIEAYASLEDMELVGVITDPGISACSIKARPGIREVLDMVKTKRVQAVIVYKLDRLARNTVEALEIAELMDSKGAALHSICEKLDTRSAMGRFFFTLLSALAEMERNLISERTRDVMQSKRLRGEACNANPPYGSRIVNNRLVPHSGELAVIKRIHDLSSDGHTIWGIIDTLTQEGIFNRKNKPFGKTQIHNILLLRKVA
jgi:site-specific DNA recombinase